MFSLRELTTVGLKRRHALVMITGRCGSACLFMIVYTGLSS